MKRGQWIVLLAASLWLAYAFWLLSNSPTTPRPEEGATWPIPNHGSTAYLTLIGYISIISPPLLGVVIALYAAWSRKR